MPELTVLRKSWVMKHLEAGWCNFAQTHSILALTPGFNELDKDKCKTIRKTWNIGIWCIYAGGFSVVQLSIFILPHFIDTVVTLSTELTILLSSLKRLNFVCRLFVDGPLCKFNSFMSGLITGDSLMLRPLAVFFISRPIIFHTTLINVE